MARKRTSEPEIAPQEAVDPPAHSMPANAIPLPVTPAQLAKCLEQQMFALKHIVADPMSPPIDGGIARIVAGIDALARIVPTIPDTEKDTP